MAILTLLAFLLPSCATAHEDAIRITPETTVGYRGGEVSTEIASRVGGGTDSIALWLAIVGLVATPILGALLYQHGFRPRRLRKENRRS
jgi:hypothetical protein